MINPQLLARQPDDLIDGNDIADKRAIKPRANTTGGSSVTEIFHGGAEGTAHVSLHHSMDSEDRGGFVLRLKIESDGQAFVPYAVNIDGGVDIHVAGETEGKHILAALKAALA
ncbi:hypothetical protein [Burkholderia sp. LMU1-1-1.1]|uniref:hypothetical protein n=1 Tax=Burkholderia sp. LMU1-1-1.1 TaxID=3135266 RepID=UPI00342AEF7B